MIVKKESKKKYACTGNGIWKSLQFAQGATAAALRHSSLNSFIRLNKGQGPITYATGIFSNELASRAKKNNKQKARKKGRGKDKL